MTPIRFSAKTQRFSELLRHRHPKATTNPDVNFR